MNFSRFRVISLSFVSFLATAVCAVAQQLPEKEEDIPVEFIPRLENTVSIGFSRMKTGPKVRFGNLGIIAQPTTTSADPSDTVSRVYSNGSVQKDGFWEAEKDLSGTPLAAGAWFTTPNWKSTMGNDGVVTVYTSIMIAQTNADGSLMQNPDGSYIPVTVPGSTPGTDTPDPVWAMTSKFLAYRNNQVRSWQVQDAAKQITRVATDPAGVYRVAMSAYGVTTAGASVEADSSGSSGFELSLEHKLGQRGRFEWGISGGLKLIGINARASAVIPAYLTVTTDIYQTVPTTQNGGLMPNISQPSGGATDLALTNLDGGGTVYQYTTAFARPLNITVGGNIEALTPLNISNVAWGTSGLDPEGRTVLVQGSYHLKGAYYLARVGPTFRYRFNDSFAVSGSVGVAQGYVGTTYKAEEAFDDYFDVYAADGKTPAPLSSAIAPQVFSSNEEHVTHKFVSGFYGELNAEYWMTERTGFYVGVTQQTMRSYTHKMSSDPKVIGRTATVDLGSTSGWKIGIMTRF